MKIKEKAENWLVAQLQRLGYDNYIEMDADEREHLEYLFKQEFKPNQDILLIEEDTWFKSHCFNVQGEVDIDELLFSKEIKQFVAVWLEGALAERKVEIVDISFFSMANAYDEDDFKAISQLDVADRWISKEYGPQHQVIRFA